VPGQPKSSFNEGGTRFSLGIVPYGIYDLGRNEGYIRIGQSVDTAEFSVSCLKKYWKEHGSKK
jgi:hypothetical protein